MNGILVIKQNQKFFSSENFNYIFNMKNGNTMFWGKTKKDNPDISPFPMLIDMEITDICNGYNGVPCPFCYKSNTKCGTYMPFNIAKNIIDKLPRGTTQIAFGVDATCSSNPDAFSIFNYAREKGFIPNVTVANVNMNLASKLAGVCGAVAVSRYEDKEICYNSVKNLTDMGLEQVNIHLMISRETLHWAYETIKDISTDNRLKKLNAIVFLSLKQKGRGTNFHPASIQDFNSIIEGVENNHINYGFDSCSANKFLATKYGQKFSEYVEPCESSLMSGYINTRGRYFPCSFIEGTRGWEEGIPVLEYENFYEIWNSKKNLEFRRKVLDCKRSCPVFKV